jgi:hypothetical protein
MFGLKFRLLVGIAALGLIAGCGGSDFPDTVPASGTVTYNGEAVEGALVTFSPTGVGEVSAASGTTDASGKFTLTSFVAGDGAMVGSYMVSISKTEGGEVELEVEGGGTESDEDIDAAYQALDAAGGEAGMSKAGGEIEDLLPAKYKVAANSGLTADVTEAGPNDFTFELTD